MPTTVPPWLIVKLRDQIAPRATAIIGGVAALVQELATRLPSGPGRLRSKAMRALFADPQLGVSTIDAATEPVGRQPDLAKIAARFA